jgi:hypothetical protein
VRDIHDEERDRVAEILNRLQRWIGSYGDDDQRDDCYQDIVDVSASGHL